LNFYPERPDGLGAVNGNVHFLYLPADATFTSFSLSAIKMYDMKKFLLFASVLTFIVLMISCKKENAKKKSIEGLTGTWELRRAAGMMTINYPPGNGTLLKFTGENYESYSNGQLINSGKYTIISDSTVSEEVCLVFQDGQYNQRIIYDNNYIDKKIFLQISDNNLSFVSGCFAYDGGSFTEYERK
jgi:hypothetical protein